MLLISNEEICLLKKTHKVLLKCDKCGKEFSWMKKFYEERFSKYKQHLCSSCIHAQTWTNYNKAQTGKTLEKRLGTEKAHKCNEKHSKSVSGKNNPNFGGIWRGPNSALNKGKTLEEIYGIEKAKEISKKLSLKASGKNNPMFGKPSPKGSGNGWSGWYKNFYFRSLLELSFIIEQEKLGNKIKSAERKEFTVEYINFGGKEKTYRPDFIINDTLLIEIKPKKLSNTPTNKLKFETAYPIFTEKGFQYKIITEKEIKNLNTQEFISLYTNKKIKFIDRYEKKFLQKYEGLIYGNE